jgi:restriction endonuclease S subunit
VALRDGRHLLKVLYYVLKNLHLETISGGMGVPELNRNDAYRKILSFPPLSKQQKIVARIEEIEAQIAEAQKIVDAAQERKTTILRSYVQV